jgi:hypothetical protein
MKNLIITSILAVLIASATTVRAQDYPEEYLGLPGDNLNLYAVMDLFRNSKTLEGFERSLNDPKSRINNLDLNRDNFVDYITVSDFKDGRIHTIVLRAILGRKEFQDVAVITVEKLRKNKIIIQLIGDETLYGKNYIIEPVYTNNLKPGYYSDPLYYGNVTVINNYYYDIFDWPVVVYIYDPHYGGWHSSWYWGYYPAYWDPWRPYYWDYYYGYHSGWHNHYYEYYHHCDYPRYKGYNDFYYHGIRQQSDQVHHRIAAGNYTETYSRPELRREGAALYTSTHATRSDETRRDVAKATNRPAAADATTPGRTAAAAANTEGRRGSASATTGKTAAAATERREAPQSASAKNPTVERRTDEIREAEGRDVERRVAEGRTAETRAAEERATEAKAAEVRTAEAREAERRSVENRATEERAAEAREEQGRVAEARAAEAREAQGRAAEARAAEAREAQGRAAEARAAEARETERKSSENRETEAKAAEARRNSGNTESASRTNRPDR